MRIRNFAGRDVLLRFQRRAMLELTRNDKTERVRYAQGLQRRVIVTETGDSGEGVRRKMAIRMFCKRMAVVRWEQQ